MAHFSPRVPSTPAHSATGRPTRSGSRGGRDHLDPDDQRPVRPTRVIDRRTARHGASPRSGCLDRRPATAARSRNWVAADQPSVGPSAASLGGTTTIVRAKDARGSLTVTATRRPTQRSVTSAVAPSLRTVVTGEMAKVTASPARSVTSTNVDAIALTRPTTARWPYDETGCDVAVVAPVRRVDPRWLILEKVTPFPPFLVRRGRTEVDPFSPAIVRKPCVVAKGAVNSRS